MPPSFTQLISENKTNIVVHLASGIAFGLWYYFYNKKRQGNDNKKGFAKKTIYERCGGQANIALVVKNFYAKVLADDTLNHHFKGVDMEFVQFPKQTQFLCQTFGGPQVFTGKNMREAHKRLKFTEADFTKFVQYLLDTFKEQGVDQETCQEIYEKIESYRTETLNK